MQQMETGSKASLLLPIFSGVERKGGEVITSRFEEKIPSVRTFVDILVAATPATPSTSRLTPLSCACPSTPFALFSPVILPSPTNTQNDEVEEVEVCRRRGTPTIFSQTAHDRTVHTSYAIHFLLPFPILGGVYYFLIRHRARYQRNKITKLLECMI